MNIVIATSPAVDDKHGVRSLPPLSIGYIAAGARTVPDSNVKIVDAYGEGLDTAQAAERILALSPDVVAVSATSMCYRSALAMIGTIKERKPDTVTVLGGYHATMFDRLLLEETPALDYVIRGEGDLSFPALCIALKDNTALAEVAGLSFRDGDAIVSGVPQQVEDLDALPYPDRAALDYDGYFHQFGGFILPKLEPIANLVSSRSCPYHCTFCPKMFPEWTYRTRSAESLFAELEELYANGIRIGFFQDENFSHDTKRLEKLCRMILDSGMKMRFMFQGTIHHLSQETFDLLHKAGFDGLFVGIESGSDDQLRRYRKPGSSRQLAEAVRRAKKAHMIVIGFFIHGGQGETLKDSAKTQDFIREVRPHVAGGSALGIQPGSILWDEVAEPRIPACLAETNMQPIHRYEKIQTKIGVKMRKKGFEKAFADSWRTPARVGEVLDLLLYNGLVKIGLKKALMSPAKTLRVIGHVLFAEKIRGIDFEKSKYASRQSG